MKNMPFLRLALLRGTVSNLTVADGQEEFIQTVPDKYIAAAVGVGLALEGLAGAASAAALGGNDSADRVQFFRCMVDGKPIAGRFSKVTFKEGDVVEVVGQAQEDGSYMAQAVRRRTDRTLWMAPHCSRGEKAHWAYVLKMIPFLTLLGWLFSALFIAFAVWMSNEHATWDALKFLFAICATTTTIMSLYFSIKIAYKWRPFVNTAEHIFAALGYAKPASVDMEKQNALYWKQHAKPDERRIVAPWVYRYVDER
jgi:hypothetical protein